MVLPDHLTTEWIADKLKGESQFQIVNQLIQLAREKVQRGQGDEFSPEPQNVALDVIREVEIKGFDFEETESEIESIEDETQTLSV